MLFRSINADDSPVAGYTGAVAWLGVAAFTFFLPSVDPAGSGEHITLKQRLGLDALALLKNTDHRVVFITAALFSNSFRVACIASLAGCRNRVGMAMHGRGWLLTKAVRPETEPGGRRAIVPALVDYNRIAIACGAEAPDTRLELGLLPADIAAAEGVFNHPGLAGREVVILNPGAAFGAAKFWPAESFANLATRLAETGRGVLILCGPAEAGLARSIATKAGHASVVALPEASEGRMSLGLSKACVARSALLVTTDSGPRHFAHAFNRPVVTLFGPTHIGWTETWHAAAIHIQKPLPCGPCQKRVCPLGHHLCMTSISPDEVLAAAMRLLPSVERRAG